MELLKRGIQSYLVILGGITILVLVWAANQYLFDTTTTETGWPLLIGITVLLVVLLVGFRRTFSTSKRQEPEADAYPWNNRR